MDVELEVDDDDEEQAEDEDVKTRTNVEHRQLVLAASDLNKEDIQCEAQRVEEDIGNENIVLTTLEASVRLDEQRADAAPQQ